MKKETKKEILNYLKENKILQVSDGPTSLFIKDKMGNDFFVKIKQICRFSIMLFYKPTQLHIMPYTFIIFKREK